MNCFKGLSEKLMARTLERQVAELNPYIYPQSIYRGRHISDGRCCKRHLGLGGIGLWPICVTTSHITIKYCKQHYNTKC